MQQYNINKNKLTATMASSQLNETNRQAYLGWGMRRDA
jgi:hypothetical protein